MNIENEPLQVCGTNPMTGFLRKGYCTTNDADVGTHTVCAKVTDDFLEYTKGLGNDLSTPRGSFPGLKDGDNWCLCAYRWEEAKKEGRAPPVILDATHEKTLEFVEKEDLQSSALRESLTFGRASALSESLRSPTRSALCEIFLDPLINEYEKKVDTKG